jgi:hypothetical protein
MELAIAGSKSRGTGILRAHFPYRGGTGIEKNELKPHLKRTWCIGTMASRFLARMEQILGLYALPYDPLYPVVASMSAFAF